MRSEPQPHIGTAWVSKSAVECMIVEFTRALPNETGGVLVGYPLSGSEGVVITDAVGPGQCATHGRTRFVPDRKYHELQVARLYEKSGRLHTYLGDWHSHPHSATGLSSTDRRTLLKIAKYRDARIPSPVMAILGETDPLVLQIWCYRPSERLGSIRRRITALQLREFP